MSRYNRIRGWPWEIETRDKAKGMVNKGQLIPKWDVGGTSGSEETFPSFLGFKKDGMVGESVFRLAKAF